jgi:hypothetical protein
MGYIQGEGRDQEHVFLWHRTTLCQQIVCAASLNVCDALEVGCHRRDPKFDLCTGQPSQQEGARRGDVASSG